MYTRKLSSVSWENKNIGSKAANLGELTRTGVPVPPGFVITSDGFDKFLKVNKLDGKIRDILTKMKENEQDVYNYAVRIENMITEAPIPDFLQSEIKEQYEELSLGQNAKEIGRIALDIIKAGREHEPVAVRPSPLVNDLSASSYAGQLSYSLNVAGLERVCRAIKKTWASLFSPRVMFYRKARNIEGILLMGVIVQKMVNPEKSGVMFTADPVTNDSNKIIIDSSWGLPDSVIYGYVSPDNYVIDKSSESVLSKTIGNKSVMRVRDPVSGGTKSERVLSDKMNIEVLETHEIAKLVELAKKIERNYNGQPQNIEWCSERGRFFIVESKPVKSTDVTFQESNTTLPSVLQGTPVSHGLVEGKVRIVLNTPEINKVVQGDLIVTKTITPDMMPIMDKVSGIITDEDSYTGYTSVISREFGIPCVIKTENATAVLKDEQEIVLDAFKGYIYSNKEEVTDSEEFTEETELQDMQSQIEDDITGTEIMLNTSSPNIEDDVLQKSDGIGMFRSEYMLTSMGRKPITLSRTNAEELINIITSNISQIAHNKPFWYRSFDALSDEFEDYTEYGTKEKNPLMGWHGVRRSLDQIELLQCEIEALRRLHSQGMTRIGLLIPLVTTPEEVLRVKEMITFPIKLGISVDTPAAALNIDALCREGVDHVCINLSMLTQLTLGVDSENSKISRFYSELNPAVVKLVKRIVEACKIRQIHVSVSSTSFEPRMVEEFIKIGIHSISVESDAFHDLKSSVSRIERKLLLEKMRESEV